MFLFLTKLFQYTTLKEEKIKLNIIPVYIEVSKKILSKIT